MKSLNKLSLQWRVTLLIVLVLIVYFAFMAAFSMLNAQRTFISFIEKNIIEKNTTINVIDKDNIKIVMNDKDSNSTLVNNQNGAMSTTAGFQKVKSEFNLSSILICIVFTLTGSVAVYFVSGKALKPVRDLKDKVSQIDEHDLSQRLPINASNDEISKLTESFNYALDRLEKAFERQKRFSASAAHELKTPLATMKAGIQVLSLDETSTLNEYKENALVIETSVDRMTKVVNDLLLLASAGEDNGELEEVYLYALFETIFDELKPLYENRNISYKITCGKERLLGNAQLLHRAFFNLIENAYKYNHIGGNIDVSVSESYGKIKIDISDDGQGISSEHIPFIFEAFYRVDASRSRKVAGSGLGLSIVKSIVEKHSGTISVSSEIEKGTTFSIQIPK